MSETTRRRSKRTSRIRRTHIILAVDLICFIGLVLTASTILNKNVSLEYNLRSPVHRDLSLNLGNGDCKWTGAEALMSSDGVYGTLLASYPASGMRVTWQQTAALTGIQVRDDFFALHLPKVGLVKTQYPHYEGIWSYGDSLDQVILLIRNPRWAIPSYHTLISEIDYAHTWELAYDESVNVFRVRPPMEDWTRWRDYRFEDEINLWGLFIDFYMDGGSKYWFQYDFERNGQTPFRLRTEDEKPWPQDLNCVYNIDCVPKTVISYENMIHQTKGPHELRKIAAVLRDKPGMTVIEDEAIDCIWAKTWTDAPEPRNEDRDVAGLPRTDYRFTVDQLYGIEAKLVEFKTKYSSGDWVNNTNAEYLVQMFDEYLVELRVEISDTLANPGPTPSPDPSYQQEIKNWYNSLGKGDRYNKTNIQMMGIWEEVKHFYDDDDSFTNITDTNTTNTNGTETNTTVP